MKEGRGSRARYNSVVEKLAKRARMLSVVVGMRNIIKNKVEKKNWPLAAIIKWKKEIGWSIEGSMDFLIF
jgi:hypothetical protein